MVIIATAAEIVQKAKEIGFDKCGIVPISRLSGYETRLEERMARFPETRKKYEDFRCFAAPQKKYPWAKSVVICSYWYGKYKIPENLEGRFAKYFLTDGRTNTESDGYKTSVAFERYLKEQGFQIAFDRLFGITSLRWAAMEAGIGIIRKNNFLYTEKGSWQYLEAFLIDQSLEYIHKCNLRPCAEKCNLCRKACPTGSLAEPYMMNRNTCVSCLTTWDGWDLTTEPLRDKFGHWIYGCEACQDVCPFNHNAWRNDEEFPGLNELGKHLSLVQIVDSDYTYLKEIVQPALWYIPADKCWRYKTNALNAMLNNYVPEYLPTILRACNDEMEPVRKMAEWVLTQLRGKWYAHKKE